MVNEGKCPDCGIIRAYGDDYKGDESDPTKCGRKKCCKCAKNAGFNITFCGQCVARTSEAVPQPPPPPAPALSIEAPAAAATAALSGLSVSGAGDTTNMQAGGGRTYEASNFRRVVQGVEAPKQQYVLMAAVHGLLIWYCGTEAARSAGVSPDMADPFLNVLQREAFEQVDEIIGQLPSAAQRMWTSAKSILPPPHRRELCSILNSALFADDAVVVQHVAVITQALNTLCIVRELRDVSKLVFPRDGLLWRGGAFPDVHRDFFRVGRKFRQPAFWASTDNKEVAEGFLYDKANPTAPCALITIKLDPRGETSMRYRCKHVNYVESTHCRGEREYLFSPYSVFEVEAVHWSPGSNYLRPHEITLRASIDNQLEPEGLPLAPCK